MSYPVHNHLEAHARFQPDQEVLFDVESDRRYTWQELYRLSRRWVRRLQLEGVGSGERISLLSHNRAETFAVLYAAAELGATLHLLNWRLAPAEMAWQLSHARPRVLLTDPAHRDVLDRPSIPLDEDPDVAEASGPGPQLAQPWMLLYTSGTTGRPKGALLTHRMIHWNAVNTVLACGLTAQSSTLTFTPLFHTGGLNCLSTPLLHIGGRIVLTGGVRPGRDLSLIAQEQITHLMGVPTIYQMLADDPGFARADLSSVQDALCGGAPLSVDLLERYLARDVPLRQGFGMTEVGPNCFSLPPAEQRRKLGSVGKPIHHVRMRLVRPDKTPCAVGEPGELWMQGPTVFGGYLDNPDANAKSFVDGWFRTGDVLSCDADGFYWVVGRQKEMFISGGENVYPAEVEAAIYQVSGVAQVAVIGVPHARWGEVGHAFVEPRPGSVLDGVTLTQALGGALARFKIPKVWTVEENLPRTGAGKIDKAALQRRLRGSE
ncbi:MAG: long-chain fatty acid--CoA ligase [Myxococcota bacterium]